MQQTTIFDLAERKKQEGIELVYRHSDSVWKREAAQRLYDVAHALPYFTSDDILENLESRGIITRDNRALAAILQSAKRMGMIEGTDNFVRCRRLSRHGAPIMQWKSLVIPS